MIDDKKQQELESEYLNEEIVKFSGKPFRTGGITAIVKGVRENPYSGKAAFEIEDGSVVDAHMCYKAKHEDG